MANRSDEVFIYLRAIGAAKTRRDIEGVAKALDRLESGTDGHTEAVGENTEAVNLNSAAHGKNQRNLEGYVGVQGKNKKALDNINRSLIKQNDVLKYNSMALRQKIAQTKQQIAQDEKAGKAAQRLADKLAKQQAQLDKNEQKRIAGVRNQTLKGYIQYERDMDKAAADANKKRQKQIDDASRMIEREHKRKEKVWRASIKAQEAWFNESFSMYNRAYRENAAIDARESARVDRVHRQTLHALVRHENEITTQMAKQRRARNVVLRKIRPDFGALQFNHPGRILKWAGIIFGIADLIPFLGTGLNAVAAGAIAAVNGLLPLTSLIATIGPAISGLGQFAIVAKILGDENLVKAIKGDADAMGELRGEMKKFAVAANETGVYWSQSQDTMQDAFFKGLGDDVRTLSEKYVPILNQRFTDTAKILNTQVRSASKWLTSDYGSSVMTATLANNNNIIDAGITALGQLTQAFLQLGLAASPALLLILDDLSRLGTYLTNTMGVNQNGLSQYFLDAYSSLKRVGRSTEDFLVGLYNIFKLSAPLTDHMGDSIEKAGKKFRTWTQSEKGVKAIKDYFKEMQPNLDAVMKLAGALARALFRLSRSKNFISLVDKMTEKGGLIESLERLIQHVDGKFIDLIIQFVNNITKLADAGLVEVLADIAQKISDIIGWLTNLYMKSPEWLQTFLTVGLVVGGLFGGAIASAVGFMGAIFSLIAAIKTLRREARLTKGLKVGGTVTGAGRGGKGRGGGTSTVVAGGGGGGTPNNKGTGAGATAIVANNGKKGNKQPKGTKTRSGMGMAGGAAATGALFALPFLGPLIDQATGAEKAIGDLDYRAQVSFASLVNGSKPVGPALDAMFAQNNNGGFDTFSEALDKVANPTKWDGVQKGVMGVFSAITGSTTAYSQATSQFEAMDIALTNLPMDQAQTGFAKIKEQAAAQKVPMDKLIGLFPNLRDRMRAAAIQANGTAGQFDNAAFAADAMAGDVGALKTRIDKLPKKTEAKIESILKREGIEAAYTALAAIDGKTAHTYIVTHRSVEEYYGGDPVPTNPQGDRWMGGMTMAGALYNTGELGPEFTLTRSGDLGIVGLDGPQMFRPPVDTAIIPASATSNPLSGNYGMAPGWAKERLQGAFSGEANRGSGIIPQGQSGAAGASETHISVGDIHIDGGGDPEAIKAAVIAALKEAERDRRERR